MVPFLISYGFGCAVGLTIWGTLLLVRAIPARTFWLGVTCIAVGFATGAFSSSFFQLIPFAH